MNNYARKEVQDGGIFYLNDKGELHRLDGPAVVGPNGDIEWYVDGKLHRLDGPAEQYIDGHKGYFVNGTNLSKIAFYTHPVVIKNFLKKLLFFK